VWRTHPAPLETQGQEEAVVVEEGEEEEVRLFLPDVHAIFTLCLNLFSPVFLSM
jgi:hypothetical protein